jgi:hypothetical protein
MKKRNARRKEGRKKKINAEGTEEEAQRLLRHFLDVT